MLYPQRHTHRMYRGTLSSELKYPLDCLVDLTWYENLLGKQQDQRPTSPYLPYLFLMTHSTTTHKINNSEDLLKTFSIPVSIVFSKVYFFVRQDQFFLNFFKIVC